MIKNLIIILVCNQVLLCSQKYEQESDLKILDYNRDGVVNPYEALDVLLRIQQESGLTINNIKKVALNLQKSREKEINLMMEDMDQNNDGKVNITELDKSMQDIGKRMDKDANGIIIASEIMTFDFLLNDENIKEEVQIIFSETDNNNDKVLTLSELPEARKERFKEWDQDLNGEITENELFQFIKNNNTAADFKIDGETAYMTGVINAETPAKVLRLIFENKEVNTIEMINVPGSVDDEANLRAALYIHKYGLNTRLNNKSIIASGGTDFFLAGKKRFIEKGAKLGVHSWSAGPGIEGADVPGDNPEHKKYLNYYKKINIPEEFYWYTLEAASAENIHWMTETEIEKYKVEKP